MSFLVYILGSAIDWLLLKLSFLPTGEPPSGSRGTGVTPINNTYGNSGINRPASHRRRGIISGFRQWLGRDARNTIIKALLMLGFLALVGIVGTMITLVLSLVF